MTSSEKISCLPLSPTVPLLSTVVYRCLPICFLGRNIRFIIKKEVNGQNFLSPLVSHCPHSCLLLSTVVSQFASLGETSFIIKNDVNGEHFLSPLVSHCPTLVYCCLPLSPNLLLGEKHMFSLSKKRSMDFCLPMS